MKRNLIITHQYLTFSNNLRYKVMIVDCLNHSLDAFESEDDHDIAR